MKNKTYRVYFTRSSVEQNGVSVHLSEFLSPLFDEQGTHFREIKLGSESDSYQIRDVVKTGRVWQAIFARLRLDAPHIVNALNEEREIDLDEGERILDKCCFIYHEDTNVVIWQVQRNTAGLSKFENYMSELLGSVVYFPQVMNDSDISKALNGNLYELDFVYDRPVQIDGSAPKWNKHTFDTMSDIHAAHATFSFRAPRGGSLTQQAKTMIKGLVGAAGVEKIKVRLTDETEPIELFMAPLKDKITVAINGSYPASTDVFKELEASYERKKGSIPKG
ncbi:MAG: DUF6731 family protein [Formosimonas sp.]